MSLAQARADDQRTQAANVLEQMHEGDSAVSADVLPPLSSPAQVSSFTGIPVQTLAYWRFEGTHLKFVKLGRMIRYRRQDVIDFIDNHVFSSTDEAKAAA